MTNDTYPSSEEKIFWGFVEWFRFWLVFDGLELKRLQQENSGKLCRESVRRIARNYSVNRGVRAAEKGSSRDCSGEWLAHTINEFDCLKHNLLQEKAGFCRKIAKEASDKNITHGRQVSAMTKLLWFRCQEGWTVYDRHASSAVGLKGNNTLDRMKEYYDILECRNFIGHAECVDETLNKEGFEHLYGCRVIDAFLMLNSKEKPAPGEKHWSENTIGNCRYFLDSLPNKFRKYIVCVGKKIPKELEYLLGK